MFWCAFISLLYVIAGIVAAAIAKNAGIYGAVAVNDITNKSISSF
jgi:hypothetical protein